MPRKAAVTDDPRRADAFQLFFIVVALASIAAPLIIGWLGERVGWSAGFAAAGVAMMVAVIVYWRGTSAQPSNWSQAVAVTPNVNPNDRRKIATLLWLVPLTALIVQPNFQMTNAYLVWGDRSFALTAFGTRLPASWLLTLDAVVGTAMLLGVTLFWRWWRQYRPEPDELTKVVIGSGFTLAGTLALVAAATSANSNGGGIGLGWPIVFHMLNDIGMAMVMPVLLALATKLAPQAWQTTVAGFYFVALFVGGLLAGWMGTRFETMPTTDFWLLQSGLALVAMIGFILLRLTIWRQGSGDKSVS